MILGVIASLLFAATGWAQIEETGTIQVQLVNATPQSRTPSGASVTIAMLTATGWQTQQIASTDAQGRVTVTGFRRLPGAYYLPIAAFDGAWYYPAQPVDLNETPDAEVSITVFDGTTSDDALRYERSAILVAGVQPDSLAIMEMSSLTNPEPRTLIGSGPEISPITARFPLPEGASAVQPQTGLLASQITTTPDGFAMTWPLTPGRHELAFSYQLPYPSKQATIERTLAYPVSTLNVYIPETGLELSSEQLAPRGTADLGGQRYRVYAATDLARGDRIHLELRGVAPPPPAGSGSQQATGILISGVLLLITGVVAAPLVRSRRRTAQPTTAPPSPALATDERARIIQEIAALDERFAQGILPEDAYRGAREALLQRAIQLTAESPRP